VSVNYRLIALMTGSLLDPDLRELCRKLLEGGPDLIADALVQLFPRGLSLPIEHHCLLGELIERLRTLLEQGDDRGEIRSGAQLSTIGLNARSGKLRQIGIRTPPEILVIEPTQLFRVEPRGRLADMREVKPLDELTLRKDLVVSVRPPAARGS
jgi:hypothetical protein